MPSLSVYLITHNEERHLASCLAAVREIADEIIVLDDGSTDRTVEIARGLGARVEYRPFDDFGPQKNAALAYTTGDWVLNLDADERVTPELADEMRAVVDANGPADGYYIRREVLYLGARLRFGGAGSDWVLRLTRRDRTRFNLTPVHAAIELDGTTARLRGACGHVKYDAMSEHLTAMNRYTDVIGAAKRAKGKTFQPWHILRIPWELFYRLVIRGAILDGRAGLIWAGMASFYAFLKYAKAWDPPSATPDPAHNAPESAPPHPDASLS